MKILLTVSIFLLIAACAIAPFPKFPDSIQYHYVTEVRDEILPQELTQVIEDAEAIPTIKRTQVARCLKFEIISKIPYKIKYLAEVPLAECNGVGGYKPADSKSLYNWMELAQAWADTRKRCFLMTDKEYAEFIAYAAQKAEQESKK